MVMGTLICSLSGLRTRVSEPVGQTRLLAFSGIHVISPKIFPQITESGFFSIIDTYLKLITNGYRIGVYPMDFCYWQDLGTIEKIHKVEDDIKQKRFNIDEFTLKTDVIT